MHVQVQKFLSQHLSVDHGVLLCVATFHRESTVACELCNFIRVEEVHTRAVRTREKALAELSAVAELLELVVARIARAIIAQQQNAAGTQRLDVRRQVVSSNETHRHFIIIVSDDSDCDNDTKHRNYASFVGQMKRVIVCS